MGPSSPEVPINPELLLHWLKGLARDRIQAFAETPAGQAIRQVGKPAAEALAQGREVGREEVGEMLRRLADMVDSSDDSVG